jgi:hypothetical protein
MDERANYSLHTMDEGWMKGASNPCAQIGRTLLSSCGPGRFGKGKIGLIQPIMASREA